MAEFRISIDLNVVLDSATSAVNEQVLPRLAQAVRAVAQQTQVRWMEAVYRAKLWSGEKTAYMESIQLQQTGPFAWLVFSDYKYASEIESGRPARDLKKMLDTSLKVRTTKDGRRFLVIPFRHNTPGNDALGPAMPQQIYDAASQLSASKVTTPAGSFRPSGEVTELSPKFGMRAAAQQRPFASSIHTRQHYMVPRQQYQWGGRLPTAMLGPNPQGKTDRYADMVRFDSRTPGGKRYSTYMTFRTMMEGSSGWIVPAQPGLHLAENISNEMRPLAEQAFTEAIKRGG
jgi:hypothetical protein